MIINVFKEVKTIWILLTNHDFAFLNLEIQQSHCFRSLFTIQLCNELFATVQYLWLISHGIHACDWSLSQTWNLPKLLAKAPKTRIHYSRRQRHKLRIRIHIRNSNKWLVHVVHVLIFSMLPFFLRSCFKRKS